MIGETVGKYRVTAKLGEGGMGEVYVARHHKLDRKVVVKLIRPHLLANEQVVQRFTNEALAAASIHHPGIVQVLDIDNLDDGRLYILMEFLEGESLASRLARETPLPERLALLWTQQAADALAAAHEVGIIHRDLKPENMFIVPDPAVPGGHRLKLLDFGIAKLVEQEGDTLTRSGTVMGTPPYMSPEQCRSSDKVEAASDLYSLGVILFEMLTGRLPFIEKFAGDYIVAHLTKAPPALAEVNQHTSPAAQTLVDTLLAKQPTERMASARSLARALEDARAQTNSDRAAEGDDRGAEGDVPVLAPTQTLLPSERPDRTSEPPRPASTDAASAPASGLAPTETHVREPDALRSTAAAVPAAATTDARAPALGDDSTPDLPTDSAPPENGAASDTGPPRSSRPAVAAAVAVTEPAAADVDRSADSNQGSRPLLWLVLAVAVLGVGVALFLTRGSTGSRGTDAVATPTTETTETNDETTSTSNATDDASEQTPGERRPVPRTPQIPPPADVAAAPAHAGTTPGGVRFIVLSQSGNRESPGLDDEVEVHYTGWTTDGATIDSSTARGEPVRFPLRGVIRGWTVGLQLMSEGDKYRFWIPPDMAYKGHPNRPQGTLVFDIELLRIHSGR